MRKTDWWPYYRTLCRIPARIRLRMATRVFVPEHYAACPCGWAIREDLAETLNLAAEDVRPFNAEACFSEILARLGMTPGPATPEYPDNTVIACVARFGGTWTEWNDVFYDITNYGNRVERAWVAAVEDACSSPSA